jgi:hypothetical protein
MEITFEAIGLEVANENAFNSLAEDAGNRGEVSRLSRRGGTLHGRCWKLGKGLEVWTLLYETADGEIFYADCRAGFRAKYEQFINPWVLTEFDEDGEAIVHGFIQNTSTEVLFQLQNLTEVGMSVFGQSVLKLGLCGLAYHAEVTAIKEKYWKTFDETVQNTAETEANEWCFSGEVLEFETLKNPQTGNELFWIYLNLGDFNLEILVNKRNFHGQELTVGSTLSGELWLQGHVLTENIKLYEGVDFSNGKADFWKHLRKRN